MNPKKLPIALKRQPLKKIKNKIWRKNESISRSNSGNYKNFGKFV